MCWPACPARALLPSWRWGKGSCFEHDRTRKRPQSENLGHCFSFSYLLGNIKEWKMQKPRNEGQEETYQKAPPRKAQVKSNDFLRRSVEQSGAVVQSPHFTVELTGSESCFCHHVAVWPRASLTSLFFICEMVKTVLQLVLIIICIVPSA